MWSAATDMVKSVIRGAVRAAVILLAAVVFAAHTLAVAYDGSAPAAQTPASVYIRAIESSADVIVHADPVHHLDQHDPFGTLAYQDDALARAARLVATSDPNRSRRYVSVAMDIADYLVKHDAMSHDHQLGWGLPAAWDAFGDKVPNPAYQVYAFQTALVSWALLDTYTITARASYFTTVERVMAAYLPHSTTSLGPDCRSCRMFWYSTSANDAGRYVKNTNVLMGQVMALLYRISGKSAYRAYATQVYNEEVYEVVRNGNYGYLGVNDPLYQRTAGPEAHIVLETFAYSQLAALLGAPPSQTKATFDRMDALFWNCGARCFSPPVALGLPPTPDIYIEFMTCYPVTFNTIYAANCARMIATPGLPNLSPFPMIGLLYALPNLPDAGA
jgi:hypothetical protein